MSTSSSDDHVLTPRSSVWRSIATTLFLSACVAGCVSNDFPSAPNEGQTPVDSSAFDYVIGEGDILDIFVWGYDDLSVTVPVRPDGRITTRLVEDLQASGRTPTELAREIEEAYTEYVNKPLVTISIDTFVGSESQQIKVIGGSAEPTTIPYERGMSLLDLVIKVGGLGEFASGNRAVLIRKQDGEQMKFGLRLDDLIRKGDVSADVPLRPGDIVIIPESWF